MPCRLIQSPVTKQEETSILWNQLFSLSGDEAKADEQYALVSSTKFTEQYGNWVEGKSKIPVNRIGEPVFRTVKDFLLYINPKQFTEEENALFNSFERRLQDFGIKKIEKEATDDESESTSYYVKNVDGKDVPIRRVTEVAKFKNKQRNGGRDYFADATPEQKEQWARKAMAGTDGHALLEDVTRAALNPDGTVKAKDDIDLSSITTNLNSTIAKLLTEYLLGNDTQIGLLYSFPPGTRFKSEQIIFSEKNNIAGTTDLIAFLPNGEVEVLDYKFMGFDTDKNLDIPVQKRNQHAIQLGEYKKILSTYGIKSSQIRARTIPIHAQYAQKQITENGKRKWLPVLQGITLGNVNIQDETRTYLLSILPEDQGTGNPKTDDLIKSLKSWYKKLYQKKSDDHSRELKIEELNTLSAAIRNLQTALNFDPLADQATQFHKNMDRLLEKAREYAGKKIKDIPKEEWDSHLEQLVSAIRIAQNYAHLDDTFQSAYEDEDWTDKQKATFEKLKSVASEARIKQEKILNTLKDAATRIALEEGVHNLTDAEKEVSGIVREFRELGAQQPKALQTFYSIFSRAKSKAKLKADEDITRFGKVFEKFKAWGEGKGKPLFDLIAHKDGHTLIAETSKDLWTKLKEASDKKDKKWLKENINQEEYDKLFQEALDKFTADVVRTSDNDEENKKRIETWKQKFDINHERFFGYDNWIIKKTLKKELWHTSEYKELLKPENKPALDMYDFITELNRKAYGSGYLSGNKSLRFLPFIMGTTVQRIIGSEKGALSAFKDSIADRFSVLANDNIKFSQIDEETGEQKKVIPKFFIQDLSREIRDGDGKLVRRDYSELSRDFARIIPLYISALHEYEAAQDIETTAEALKIVEANKGHLEVDKLDNIVTQGGTPRVFQGNERNTDILEQFVDDAVYGIKYDRASIADKMFSTLTADEEKKTSAMKVIQQTNKLVQLKALGLKMIVAIPNYFGANMQALINSGRLFTAKEFFSNEARIIGSAFQGKEGNITRALIDYFVPLNEDLVKHRTIKNTKGTEKLKYLSMSDVLMSTLSTPDKVIQLSTALSVLDNTMVENGRLVNIRDHLKNQPEFKSRYTSDNVREIEKGFEAKVKELQEKRSLKKIASFDKDGNLVIPGVEKTSDTVAEYRNLIIQTSKQITGQMSEESKRLYSRDIIKRSFMMFKNWIPSQIESRFGELKYNKSLDTWEYGRIRVAVKVARTLGLRKIGRMKDIISASPEGLKILHQLWEEKREDFFRKNGRELSEEMSEEQFYDLIRSALTQEAKELSVLLSMTGLILGAYVAAPPPDEDAGTLNMYKMLARTANKTADEILFYYNPLSFESITRGTILPSIGILSDGAKVFNQTLKLTGGAITGNQEWIDEAHPTKALFNALPITSYFSNELLPLLDPELAKEMGIRVTSEARPNR